MLSLKTTLRYTGPIFDTHTHGIDTESLDLMVSIQKRFGVEKCVLICHSPGIMRYAKKKYPGLFVFAKYFSGTMRFTEGVHSIAREIRSIREEGYHLAKMQSAPMMRGRARVGPEDLRLHEDGMAPMFEALQEEDLKFILHVSDPDTYYTQRYTDKTTYSTKERDLAELEGVLARYYNLQFQIAHFASQPEARRLGNLARWFETYSNFNIDTSSARWMSRELSKNPADSKEFIEKYSSRIQFGTDCVGFTDDVNYYEGRYSALRTL
ncbi:MAG: amidohydrolase family protein, partial [Candidatus Hodarchaeota archaeon]